MHSVTNYTGMQHFVLTESVELLDSAQYYGSWPYTETYYYSCSSSSTSLTGCSKSYVSSSSCNSDDQVGLWCMTQPQTGKYMYILHDLVLSCLHNTFDWCTEILTFVLQYALVELFGWWEEHHPIKANWSTVTMEHGLLFVTLLMMKRLQ